MYTILAGNQSSVTGVILCPYSKRVDFGVLLQRSFINGDVGPNLYAFNVDVPVISSFEMRLFTRMAADESNLARPIDVPVVDQVVRTQPPAWIGRRVSTAGSVWDGYDDIAPMAEATTAEAREDRDVQRMERNMVHVITTMPSWQTIFIVWNDRLQSWIKSGRPISGL